MRYKVSLQTRLSHSSPLVTVSFDIKTCSPFWGAGIESNAAPPWIMQMRNFVMQTVLQSYDQIDVVGGLACLFA